MPVHHGDGRREADIGPRFSDGSRDRNRLSNVIRWSKDALKTPRASPPLPIVGWPSPFIGWAWVSVLLLAYTSSFIDRQILSLLVDPIKADLGLSDTQFSLIGGMAFAIFYSTVGMPLGALVDRYPRRLVASTGLAFWSTATMFCGLSGSYVQLLTARTCVAVGEASLAPSAGSLLADCFPPARLSRPISVYMLGAAIGAGLALILGGAIITLVASHPPIVAPHFGELRPWQTVFILVGLLGLPVFGLMWLLPEPARRESHAAGYTPDWREAFAFVRGQSGLLLPFLAGAACCGMVSQALMGWGPAYYMRSFDLDAGKVGTYVGIATILGIGSGLLGGAWLAERLISRGRRDGHLIASAIGIGLGASGSISAILAPDPLSSMILLGIAMCGNAMPTGIGIAYLQTVTPNRLRGRITAIYFGIVNIVGASFGPLLPALLADYIFRDEARIGAAVAIIAGLFGAIGVPLFLRAARVFQRSI